MTSRIYITGDVGDLSTVTIYDADTDEELDDVRDITLDLSAVAIPKAQLVRYGPAGGGMVKESVLIVPKPPHPLAGVRVRRFELKTWQDRDAEITRATMTGYRVLPDGTLDPETVEQASDAVSDMDMATRRNPSDLKRESIEKVLGLVFDKVRVDLLITAPHTPPLGNFVMPEKATQCPECWGSGRKNGLGPPCSKGCKQP